MRKTPKNITGDLPPKLEFGTLTFLHGLELFVKLLINSVLKYIQNPIEFSEKQIKLNGDWGFYGPLKTITA